MSLGGVCGFDLGNRNSVVCQAKRGSIETVLNESSKRLNPFIVSFQGKERFRGADALPLSKINYKNTVVQAKRLIGRNWSDPEVQEEIKLMPNASSFKQLEGDKIGVEVMFNDEQYTFTPEEITAMMIGKLRETVEVANEGIKAADIVFSVPGYWTDRQRRALLDACSMVQAEPLSLLNDHTAAALAYGIYKSARQVFDVSKKQYVMFVDMGHADTSVAIVAFVQGKLQVVSTAYDRNLGGRDFDYKIMHKFANEFKAKHNLDVFTNKKAVIKLLDAAEKAKQTLTPEGVTLANAQVEFLMNEIDFRTQLSLDEFEEISSSLLKRLEIPLARCIEEAGVSSEELHAIEIIGGGTRPRCVKRKIAEVLKLDMSKVHYGLSTTLNADESVARGCALNSAMLSPRFNVKDFAIYDLAEYPIRLTWDQREEPSAKGDEMDVEDDGENVNGTNSIIIMQRGQETPKTRRVTFRRREPFEIVASYDDEAIKLLPPGTQTKLSSFRISGMPNNPSLEPPKIRVNARYQKDSTFSVVSAQYLEEVPIKEDSKASESKENGPTSESNENKNEVDAKEEKETKQDNAMDTSGEANEEAKEEQDTAKAEEQKNETEKKPKKKQFKKTELKVEGVFHGTLSPKELQDAKARQQKIDEQDRLLAETAAAKNALETYIYAYRDKVETSLREFVTSEESESFREKLNKEESWLYDEGFDVEKIEYQKKLEALKEEGDRYETRYIQQQERPQASRALSSAVNDFLAVANSSDEKYSHLTEEDRNKVRKVCDDAMKWLDMQNAGQEKLPQTSDPVLTSSMIYDELRKVQAVSNPIVTKKKPPPPKPKPTEKEKKNDEKKDNDVEMETGDKKPDEENNEPQTKEEGKQKTEDMETDLD